MRLVLDTNTVVSALIWGGNPRDILNRARNREISLFTSAALLLELEAVLKRPKFQPILDTAKIEPAYLMQRYGSMTQLVVPKPISRTVRDIDDDVVLGTALAADAQIVVTGDQDLLILNPWNDIRILDSTQAIDALVAR